MQKILQKLRHRRIITDANKKYNSGNLSDKQTSRAFRLAAPSAPPRFWQIVELGSLRLLGRLLKLIRSSTASAAPASLTKLDAPTVFENLTQFKNQIPQLRFNETDLRIHRKAESLMRKTCSLVTSPRPPPNNNTASCHPKSARDPSKRNFQGTHKQQLRIILNICTFKLFDVVRALTKNKRPWTT